jgi:hypothetical protein
MKIVLKYLILFHNLNHVLYVLINLRILLKVYAYFSREF